MSLAGNGPFELVIAGGSVMNGDGGDPTTADVGIRAGRIDAVGDLAAASRITTIDAAGLVVAPGFVDIHSHSDVSLLADPRAESDLLQGVTTVIVGNCGHGPAPMADTPGFRANLYGALLDLALDWTDVPGYLDRLTAVRPAVNVATLVPNGNLRLAIVGPLSRPATPTERQLMAVRLEAALDAGAIGLSTGLEYPLEAPTSSEDLAVLCRAVARRNGVHSCHTRARGADVIEATREALEVGRTAEVRTQIAHALPRLEAPPGTLDRLLEMLGEAGASLDVAWDMHTRTFAGAGLGSLLPAVAHPLGASRASIVAEARSAVAAEEGLLGSFARAGWEQVSLTGWDGSRGSVLDREVAASGAPSLAEVAAATGDDPLEVLVDAWLAAGSERDGLMVHAQTYDEDGISAIVTAGRGMPASDSASQSRGGPYPKVILQGSFSWAAWTFRRLVRERHDLGLGEAIMRLSSLPASRAGLPDRGRLVVGAAADAVVFDAATIADRATLERPFEPAVGVRHVLVNGEIAVTDGRLTGCRAGTILRA
jgi:N-acyl-D-amino-acid deacylase